MGYVENNLLPNEEILFIAKIHWIRYMGAVLSAFLGIVLTENIPVEFTSLRIAMISLFTIIAIAYFLDAFIFSKTTELVITSKRVIAKFGLIRRNTIELNHSQVESLMVEQGIINRLVDAGTIIIQGTGGSKTPIPSIIKPLEFRKEYFRIIENNK